MHRPLFRSRLVITPQAFQHICRYGSAPVLQLQSTSPLLYPRAANNNKRAQPRAAAKPASILDEDDGQSFRFFNQDEKTGAIHRVEEDERELQAAEMLKQLHEARARVRSYDASIDSETFHNNVVQLFPEEDRAELAQSLRQMRKERTDRRSALEIRMDPSSLVAPVIAQVNKYLRRVAEEPDNEKYPVELWKWYFRARRSVTGFHDHLSQEAWDILWSILPAEERLRQHRALELSDAMMEAGQALSWKQKEERGRALIGTGRSLQAISELERDESTPRYREQGCLENQMILYTLTGKITKATTAFMTWLEQYPDADHRTAFPLLQAGIKKWIGVMYTRYLLLRRTHGAKFTLEDYDVLLDYFLSHAQKHYARAIFKDMLRGRVGDERTEHRATREEMRETEYIECYSQWPHGEWSFKQQESLKARLQFPMRWRNKFVYASWLRRLISNGNHGGSAKVISLMLEDGVRPDALHVNGLAGGLIRSGEEHNIARAETIAWTMIRQRLAFVQQRGDAESSTQHALATFSTPTTIVGQDELTVLKGGNGGQDVKIRIDTTIALPPANAETFNVLSLHYLLTQQWGHLRHLILMRSACKLRMTSFFMNHILYTELYDRGPDAMWSTFLHFVDSVKPDLETFNCLWHASQDASSRSTPDAKKAGNSIVLPRPRELFATMLAWRQQLDVAATENIAADFGDEVYARVILTFCEKRDFDACIVALHAIWREFGVAPTDDVAPLLINGLADMYERRGDRVWLRRGGSGRSRLRGSEDKLRETVERVLEGIQARRTDELLREGMDVNDMSAEQMAELHINALSELVRTLLMQAAGKGSDGTIEKRIADAAKVMGVPGLGTGDLDCFSLV